MTTIETRATTTGGRWAAPLALALLALWILAGGPAAGQAPAVPSYTNDDLERVRPLRNETGVASEPAFAGATRACSTGRRRGRAKAECESDTETASAPSAASSRGAEQGEAYWRREARRVAERVRRWREQVQDLEQRIDERRRQPGVRPYTDPQVVALERRAESLRERMRELENDLAERALRARALPGWLR
jgi:polyhydroxyalkanoate synthesis regulator phasin